MKLYHPSHLDDLINKAHMSHRVSLFGKNLLQVLHLFRNIVETLDNIFNDSFQASSNLNTLALKIYNGEKTPEK